MNAQWMGKKARRENRGSMRMGSMAVVAVCGLAGVSQGATLTPLILSTDPIPGIPDSGAGGSAGTVWGLPSFVNPGFNPIWRTRVSPQGHLWINGSVLRNGTNSSSGLLECVGTDSSPVVTWGGYGGNITGVIGVPGQTVPAREVLPSEIFPLIGSIAMMTGALPPRDPSPFYSEMVFGLQGDGLIAKMQPGMVVQGMTGDQRLVTRPVGGNSNPYKLATGRQRSAGVVVQTTDLAGEGSSSRMQILLDRGMGAGWEPIAQTGHSLPGVSVGLIQGNVVSQLFGVSDSHTVIMGRTSDDVTSDSLWRIPTPTEGAMAGTVGVSQRIAGQNMPIGDGSGVRILNLTPNSLGNIPPMAPKVNSAGTTIFLAAVQGPTTAVGNGLGIVAAVGNQLHLLREPQGAAPGFSAGWVNDRPSILNAVTASDVMLNDRDEVMWTSQVRNTAANSTANWAFGGSITAPTALISPGLPLPGIPGAPLATNSAAISLSEQGIMLVEAGWGTNRAGLFASMPPVQAGLTREWEPVVYIGQEIEIAAGDTRIVSSYFFENTIRTGQFSSMWEQAERYSNITDDGKLYIEMRFTDGTNALMQVQIPAPGCFVLVGGFSLLTMRRWRRAV